jgi:hypothetical protein
MFKLIGSFLLCGTMLAAGGCDEVQPETTTGVTKANATIQTGTDGLTAEQRNVRDRLVADNKPGSIKHLYLISAYSGQVLLYSTVKGKVTSSGKRLTPTTANYASNGQGGSSGFEVSTPNGNRFFTSEVLQDDGTYGSSVEYLYWWDVQGRYHQQYVTGGMILHISDQPIPVKSITINLEAQPN